MSDAKIIDRIRKLLNLTKSNNEHEAAAAGAKAAQLMREHEIGEAMLRVSDDTATAEPIIEGGIEGTEVLGRQVAWKLIIAAGAARAFGVQEWRHGGRIVGLGRTSAVQSWNYTCQYLFNEVMRLADAAWVAYPTTIDRMGGNARAWKNAFRVGAASVIRRRFKEQAEEANGNHGHAVAKAAIAAGGAADSGTQALAIIERDRTEVAAAYKDRAKDFGKATPIGQTSSRAGYVAGRKAGAKVDLGGGSRAGLPAPKTQIRGGR